MKTYTDLDQYNPTPDIDDPYEKLNREVKILQNLDVSVPSNQKRNTTIIQNMNVSIPEKTMNFDSVIRMIREYGGVQNFITALYCYAIESHDGNVSMAARHLGIDRRTLNGYRNKQITE